ncbi:hypothetical protein JW897_20145 [Chromobacterium alkanivorans]|uniref:PP_RS20740 family protein n=1 Tax=Chromobacterium alkanivorans TaxID=1071719 RepID=UPI001966D522|nr:hypothetical protein [Chromobacterium alkanivorans]MBN3006053.1 hypothetical protein [Chromobacterium alkanivorans]
MSENIMENMDDDPFAIDSSLIKGVAPVNIEHTSPHLKKDFAPWHKPRKQWIRDNQWGVLISSLIKKLNTTNENRPLNYLSLPGVDLLDIRSFEQVFTELNARIQFLGLNYIEEDQDDIKAEQALSLNEVRSLDFVDQESNVITEQFEELSDDSSIVSRRVLQEHKTFDVINLDLCASFAKYKPGTVQSLYTAIHKLLHHQSYYRTEDWLFFITTRVDKKKVDPDAFLTLIESALNSLPADMVNSNLIEKFGLDQICVENKSIAVSNLTSLQHKCCFTATYGIWKLKLLIDCKPQSKSKMHPPYEYHVESEDETPDMVSMSFWCSRIPSKNVDTAGLSKLEINGQLPDSNSIYIDYAQKAFDASLNAIDLDAFLSQSQEKYQGALERSKLLLKKARYSIEDYERWLIEQQNKINSMLAPKY